MTAEELISFESGTKHDWESGDLPCLLHLAGGNEEPLIKLFSKLREGDWVFSTHRNHYHALLAGIPWMKVRELINNGRSMFVYSRDHNFFCSAVLAGCTGTAPGVASALKEEESPNQVICFIGDGGEDQGHFYEAARLVEAWQLPCTFIIEDNDRSVDTPKLPRHGGAPGLEKLFSCVHRYYYEPTYPHAGSGCKSQITFKPEAIERMRRT